MPSELIIRPGLNDHRVVADLLAPGGAGVFLSSERSLISRLVLDAHVAPQRPEFAEAAAAAGTPVLIDPLTPLWQGVLRPQDKWAQLVPFATVDKLSATDLASEYERERMVELVVDFQLSHGASGILPPYAYASSPDDPWFTRNLQFLRSTARYMRRAGIRLPLIPLLCGQLNNFADPRNAVRGVDRFAAAALDIGPQAIALCMSPAGAGADSYAKILRLFDVAGRVRRTGVPTLAWRQGVYGPALVSAGLAGYETGIATRETCDIARSVAARKPAPPGTVRKSGGAALGIYIEPLRRSIPARVGLTLLGDRTMRPRVMCDDERCCPNGVSDTIDRRREHSIRTRAKELAAIDAQPHVRWRLHQTAKNARAAADLSVQVNAFFKGAGLPDRINPRNMEELARVAEFLQDTSETRHAA